jgi:hypothetical protein
LRADPDDRRQNSDGKSWAGENQELRLSCVFLSFFFEIHGESMETWERKRRGVQDGKKKKTKKKRTDGDDDDPGLGGVVRAPEPAAYPGDGPEFLETDALAGDIVNPIWGILEKGKRLKRKKVVGKKKSEV